MRGRITAWFDHVGIIRPDPFRSFEVFISEGDLPEDVRASDKRVGLEVTFEIFIAEGVGNPRARGVTVTG